MHFSTLCGWCSTTRMNSWLWIQGKRALAPRAKRIILRVSGIRLERRRVHFHYTWKSNELSFGRDNNAAQRICIWMELILDFDFAQNSAFAAKCFGFRRLAPPAANMKTESKPETGARDYEKKRKLLIPAQFVSAECSRPAACHDGPIWATRIPYQWAHITIITCENHNDTKNSWILDGKGNLGRARSRMSQTHDHITTKQHKHERKEEQRYIRPAAIRSLVRIFLCI